MSAVVFPANEAERLAVLRSYEIVDTGCEEAFENIAHLAADLTGSPVSLVSLIDADRQWFKARVGLDATEARRAHAFCAHAILNPRLPLVVPDAALDIRFADNPLVLTAPAIRFYAGMPLVSPEGVALGTICVIDHKPREIKDEQLKALGRLAQAVVTTLELRRSMNRVRDLARVDPLTGLPNRAALIEELERVIARHRRNDGSFALLYLDLDGFKHVNDEFGHAAGDEVLRAVAGSLTASLRLEDLAGRLGGDEFAAVLIGELEETSAAAARVRAAIQHGLRERGWNVTASIGAASFIRAPLNADTALAAADSLMYAAKRRGKDQVNHELVG